MPEGEPVVPLPEAGIAAVGVGSGVGVGVGAGVGVGVGAGVGVEIASHVQISCQLFRNMGPLYNKEKVQESYRSSYDHLKNYQGMKINLAILF